MPAISDSRIRTLGLRTDLALERERAVVSEHDGFVAVRTPGNPGYHFGNYLIYDRAPESGDALRWISSFEEIFGGDPAIRHGAFAWSGEPGAVRGFTERGYAVHDRAVLTASDLREFELPHGLHVRPLRDEHDWQAQYALSLANREPVYDEDGYARFKAAQIAYHRRISERSGAWLGMFDGANLVGSCGIFSAGDAIARYADVGVLPTHRNRGIARCLVSTAGRFAMETLGARRLVIVADAADFPRRIYERCGFTLFERECALWISVRD